ncbi:MAG: cell shape determining protein, MreB/Mrl family [Chloroflexi bacterium]|nr:cell shape determining protein, MreB/Mrl family [Chloroflexota bacterium]
MFGRAIGIDLGTANILVYVQGKGIVLNEPSVVAYSATNDTAVVVGTEARKMLGRAPGRVIVTRPMREGVIADYMITQAMLRHVIRKVCGRFSLFKPTAMVCIPVGVTGIESRAVLDATLQAGAREAFLIPEPLAAAIGAGVPIADPSGNMIVDIGGGTSEAAIISLNDIVVSNSIRVGGNKLDDVISTYVKRRYNLIIGERTAEEIKIQIGSALPLSHELQMEVRGRDQVDGLPKSIILGSTEVTEAMSETLVLMIGNVKSVLEQTPPELAADVVDRGMLLTGGGSLLRNLDTLLARETGVAAYIAEDPLSCVAIGAGRALEKFHIFKDCLTSA